MVMLQRWSVLRRVNDHVREVHTLMEGELQCYGGCHINRGRKVIRGSRWSV